MKYFKKYVDQKDAVEVTAEEAKRALEGWWNDDALHDIFTKGIAFRLYTPYCEVWTNDNGKVPMAGFYGTCGSDS